MPELSYQLYSSRNFPPLKNTLHMLAGLGYRQVEGFGGVYSNTDEVRELLTDTGLAMKTGHFGLDILESDPDGAIKIARDLGMEAVYCPHLEAEKRPTSPSDWRDFGAHLERVGKPLVDAGLSFGWHNHDFEFTKLDDGTMPIEHIFAGGQSLSWEADLGWVARAGADPFEWVERYGGRMTSVHVKDIAPEGECMDEDGWADVGHGTIDWKQLFDAVTKTPNRYFVMEHDNPSDDERFASRSFKSVTGYQE